LCRQPTGSSGQLVSRLDLGINLLIAEVDGRNSNPFQLVEEGCAILLFQERHSYIRFLGRRSGTAFHGSRGQACFG
jgi:hypothetical protein